MPKVTVILCAYNQAAYVEDAIQSVLSQTHRDIELIIIDNGSTDDVRPLLARYETDPRIRFLLHDRNESFNRRMNEAVRLSSGEFVCLLPADDYFLPRKLERQVEAFASLPEDYGVVHCPAYRLNVETQERWIDPTLKRSGAILEDMLLRHFTEGFINPITPLMRRECLLRYPCYEDLFVEGESLYLRLALSYKFHYIDEPLAVMREHSSNMGKAIKRNTEIALTLLDRLALEREFPPRLVPALRTFRADLLANCGWLGLRMAADPAWSREMYLGAIRLRPARLVRVRTLVGLTLSLLPAAASRAFNRSVNALRAPKETLAVKADWT